MTQDTVTATTIWEPKDQPQPCDVVSSVSGERADVWIFQGVKIASFDNADEATTDRTSISTHVVYIAPEEA